MSNLIKLNKITDHLSEVIINRPEKLNAMTKPMWIELGKIFKKISKVERMGNTLDNLAGPIKEMGFNRLTDFYNDKKK